MHNKYAYAFYKKIRKVGSKNGNILLSYNIYDWNNIW